MFRIRRVVQDSSAVNAATLRQVCEILRRRFPGVDEARLAALPQALRAPTPGRLRPLLLVAEGTGDRVRGFALMLQAMSPPFMYLDYLAAAVGRAGGGIGGALYERCREQARAAGAMGLFFECLPDDPALSPDPAIRRQNIQRLRFYERFGARPVAGTAYETPLKAGDTDPPYLMFDNLGTGHQLTRDQATTIVRTILEERYAGVCTPVYIEQVIASFTDNPVQLRPPRYHPAPPVAAVRALRGLSTRIPVAVNDRHDIHHVRERGYVQAPVRVAGILRSLRASGLTETVPTRHFPDSHIREVHDPALVDFLRRACLQTGNDTAVYPYVFPIRNALRPPDGLPLRAGYFCIDTFTPINANAWHAARRAVDCTLTVAERVLEGDRVGYALVRPPGHHAERRAFGGFCYLNNAAIAAHYFSRFGRVAVLDIDYHHGNGTQEIFEQRDDVLTVSIHGHPRFAYPYFSGFANERGSGPGYGFNLNLPLPETITARAYDGALSKALRRIKTFSPDYVVVSAGFDTGAGDPTGSWPLRGVDFQRIGKHIGALGHPLLIVQEGGYRIRTLGGHVRQFLKGIREGVDACAGQREHLPPSEALRVDTRLRWREALRPGDMTLIQSLVNTTAVFSPAEVQMAGELAGERLTLGTRSSYRFVIAERGRHLVGYACYGAIPGTEGRFDLYWIAVAPSEQGKGLGTGLLRRVVARLLASGARRLYVETGTGTRYIAARAFYRQHGFRVASRLPDYYHDGEGKLILLRDLSTQPDS